MSTSTPPGWYPVTGPDGTAQERRWDGNAWTADVRPAGGAGIADAPTQAWAGPGTAPPAYGYPQQPPTPGYGYPQQPPPSVTYGYPPQAPSYAYPSAAPAPKNRNALIIGIAAVVVVLAVVVGAVVVLSGKDDNGPVVADPSPAVSAPATAGDSPSASPSAPSDDSTSPGGSTAGAGTLPDTVHGWNVPQPADWSPESGASSTVAEVTGPYDCDMASQCVRGQFAVQQASVPGTDAASVARAAMELYAPKVFGDLDSHEELTSGPLKVAGATGYAVRWYVTPKEGAKGYVMVVAVPDAAGKGFVLMRGGVDDDPKAPSPDVLDRIVAGIRSAVAGSGA